MPRAARLLLFLAVVTLGRPVAAVSLSGIVLYASDDFGVPNGHSTYDGQLSAQLWRTALGGQWHGLAVLPGLPPDSLRAGPLNARNFLIEIPLSEGENTFTLLGEPGTLTRTDEYDRFTINLFFDGNVDGPPGISALFAKFAARTGSGVSQNRSDFHYNLWLQAQPEARPPLFHDDGIERVAVQAVAFLPPERFEGMADVDLVGARSFGKSGEPDFLGVLKLFVSYSEGANADEWAGAPSVQPGFAPPAPAAGSAGGWGGLPAGVPPGGLADPWAGQPAAQGLPAEAVGRGAGDLWGTPAPAATRPPGPGEGQEGAVLPAEADDARGNGTPTAARTVSSPGATPPSRGTPTAPAAAKLTPAAEGTAASPAPDTTPSPAPAPPA